MTAEVEIYLPAYLGLSQEQERQVIEAMIAAMGVKLVEFGIMKNMNVESIETIEEPVQ